MFNPGQPYLAFNDENLARNRIFPSNSLNPFQDTIDMHQSGDTLQAAVSNINSRRRKRFLVGSGSTDELSLPAKRRATEEEISKQLSNLNLSFSPSNSLVTEAEIWSEGDSSDESSVEENRRLLILPEALRRNHADLSTSGTISDPDLKKLFAPKECLALVPYVPRPHLPIPSIPISSSTPEVKSFSRSSTSGEVDKSRPIDVVTEEPMEVLASPTPAPPPLFFNLFQPAGFPVATPPQSTVFYEGMAGEGQPGALARADK